MRGAATLIVSAVRLAAARANTTGRPARLVFDLDEKRLLLEESVGSHFARSKVDVAGGAEAATDVEKAAREESERVLEGPRAARQEFVPVPVLTDPEDPTKGRDLRQRGRAFADADGARRRADHRAVAATCTSGRAG